MVKPMEPLTRSGLFGPWDKVDLGEMPPGVNPANCEDVCVCGTACHVANARVTDVWNCCALTPSTSRFVTK